MIDTAFKQKVVDRLRELETASGLSGNRFAQKIGINPAQWSRLKAGELDGVLADGKFVSLARENNINFGEADEWITVETAAFNYFYSLFKTCHEQSISNIVVDVADIGKTHTAKFYSENEKNAIYIDCSQSKSKQMLIRNIARKFGITQGKYYEVYNDLVFYLNSCAQKVIIFLDEVADVEYAAELELKALWNATEGNVAWVKIGADGLKKKINLGINHKKVGYAENFRRYGSKFKQATPIAANEVENFKRDQVAQIAIVNAPAGTDIQKLVKASANSITNVRNMIKVLKSKAA